MPVQLTYPGVYIQEIPSGVSLISGVATSVALFIGMSQNGPLDTPTEVLSISDYQDAFGTDITAGEMPDQVGQFFLNGGATAWIMRIADNTAAASSLTLENEFGTAVIALDAKNAGTIGDTLRLIVDYDTPTPEMTFNLTAYRVTTAADGTITSTGTEVYSDLSMNPNGPNYFADVLNDNSSLIAPSAAGQPNPPSTTFAGYSLGGIPQASADAVFAAIKAAATAAPGGLGSFAISVDGAPAQLITLNSTSLGGTAAADAPLITSTINTALGVVGKQIAAVDTFAIGGGTLAVMRFTSAAMGGSVRISSAPGAADIAGTLGWTSDTGALEIGGYAKWRPAPNGLFASLGDFTGGSALSLLSGVLGASKTADVPGPFKLGDTPANTLGNFTPAWGPGATMWNVDTGNANSFANFKTNLSGLVAALNTYFNSAPTPSYSASLVGFRVMIEPISGNVDTGTSMVFSTDPAAVNKLSAFLPSTSANSLAYRVSGATKFVSSSTAGNNGGVPQLGDYNNAFATATSQIDIFNIVMLPRAATQTDNARANLWGPASAFAKSRRAFLIVDPPSAWKTPADASGGMAGARIGMVKDYAAIYWPRVSIPDPVTGIQRYVDPAGTVAGCYARTDAARGVWKAPAGLDNATTGVLALERRLSDAENGLLNPLALNVLRVFTDGIIVWGARTMDGYDNSGDIDYRYVPVRRTALYIEESLYRGLKWAVFEPNDDRLWARIRLSAGNFMNTMFRQGAFQGQTKDTAYFVKCDSSTTSQSDIDLGIVNVIVGFAPLRPAEFVVVSVTQMAGQVQS